MIDNNITASENASILRRLGNNNKDSAEQGCLKAWDVLIGTNTRERVGKLWARLFIGASAGLGRRIPNKRDGTEHNRRAATM